MCFRYASNVYIANELKIIELLMFHMQTTNFGNTKWLTFWNIFAWLFGQGPLENYPPLCIYFNTFCMLTPNMSEKVCLQWRLKIAVKKLKEHCYLLKIAMFLYFFYCYLESSLKEHCYLLKIAVWKKCIVLVFTKHSSRQNEHVKYKHSSGNLEIQMDAVNTSMWLLIVYRVKV